MTERELIWLGWHLWRRWIVTADYQASWLDLMAGDTEFRQ